ncbi:tyrosyl-DNA phosphodiesterase [Xylariaceae sp. FL0255]|nr:tyrosyl-DNA phosphodiesterase [Xylariaceae sp. FL0255]
MDPGPTKRPRLDHDSDDTPRGRDTSRKTPSSLAYPISPPRKRRVRQRQYLLSPFHLTKVASLPSEANEGAVSLRDLVGDPLTSELWEFNYLHDIDFLLQHLDPDTRALTQVHIVHGFWKREDGSRLFLQEQKERHQNVTLHTAYMPEMYGTHHSKMMIMLRHDDTAQVIIHTANMIERDWRNMTQGVWCSPPLPLLKSTEKEVDRKDKPIGSGPRFKFDLLNYLRAYNMRRNVCRSLVEKLSKYDFSAIRGALIASVPGKHSTEQGPSSTRWGWQGLRETLKTVPVQDGPSNIVVQISSIATLGAKDDWLQRTLFDSLAPTASSTSSSRTQSDPPRPNFKVVFPAADEIRQSLDGYVSGGSIHTKIQSAQQTKQLEYLRPIFHHWADVNEVTQSTYKDAGRDTAAPHIKTYIRHNQSKSSLDWALLTSANLSKQAWGEAPNKAGEVRVASWEIGVLVWPALYAGEGEDFSARMVGTFRKDKPTGEDDVESDRKGSDIAGTVVGLRMPYSMPLLKYGPREVPWIATMAHTIPDRHGQTWP